MLSFTSVDVSIEDINNFFGPRLNKNGWKYDDHPYVKMVKLIKKGFIVWSLRRTKFATSYNQKESGRQNNKPDYMYGPKQNWIFWYPTANNIS